MKFRTDFVTNSSSSSFITVTMTSGNSEDKTLINMEDVSYDWNDTAMPILRNGMIEDCAGNEIRTPEEMAACVMGALIADSSFEGTPLSIRAGIFEWLNGKKSAEELYKEIAETDETFFYEPFDVNSDTFVDEFRDGMEEIIDDNWGMCLNYFEEIAECIEPFNSIKEISGVTARELRVCRDEFLNRVWKFADDEGVIDGMKFKTLSEDNPEYEEAVERWAKWLEETFVRDNCINNEYEYLEEYDSDSDFPEKIIKEALQSGDINSALKKYWESPSYISLTFDYTHDYGSENIIFD